MSNNCPGVSGARGRWKCLEIIRTVNMGVILNFLCWQVSIICYERCWHRTLGVCPHCPYCHTVSGCCLCFQFSEDGTMFTLNIWHDGSKQFKCISECNLTEWVSVTNIEWEIQVASLTESQLQHLMNTNYCQSFIPVSTVALALYSQPQQYENVLRGKKSWGGRVRGKGQYKTFLGWYMQEMPRSNI